MKHIVGFSGGIDSQTTAGLVLDRNNHNDVILMNSNAGENEDPLTDLFVEWYSVNVHPIVRVHATIADFWDTPGYLVIAQAKDTKIGANLQGITDDTVKLTFTDMMRLKGRAPSRTNQFCTEILKLRPQRRWIAEAFGPTGMYAGESFCRYSGVRRDESKERENTPDQEWDDYYDCDLFHPVAAWTKPQCFEFVKARGEEINPLYLMGFNRVGCAPCINSGKEDVLNWLLRRPEMMDKVRRMEKEAGCTFFPPMVPGTHHNTVDEVVAWAKTEWGGKQFRMYMPPSAGCTSKYGLCE